MDVGVTVSVPAPATVSPVLTKYACVVARIAGGTLSAPALLIAPVRST
jgi:hypothetical protein